MSLILIVDDEPDLVNTLEYNLQREGYQTRSAANGEEAVARATQQPIPDLVLLDLMLPDFSGVEVCRQLRQNDLTRGVPVIMLTARTEEIDRVVGFEVGADDYVVKPYSVRELLLRIRAIMRRAEAPTGQAGELSIGPLRVDTEGHRVWVEGREVALTALELKLLLLLINRRGRVQTREQLLETVWDMHADVTTRTVDTHVKRLRQKIGAAGPMIETRRGIGYRFRPPGDDGEP